MLKAEHENELVSQAQRGDQKAMHALIEAHMPMIRKFARSSKDASSEDLESQLIMAFIEYLPKYELERGFRVNTYMRWWMRQTMIEFNHKNKDIVTTPSAGTIANLVSRVRRAKRDLSLYNENNHESHMLIAGKAGVSIEDVAFAETWGNPRITRLDINLNEGESDQSLELPAEDFDILEKLTFEQRFSALSAALEILKPREKDVISRRWLADMQGKQETLESVSNSYNITRERVRQIEAKALQKVVKTICRQSSHLIEPGHVAIVPHHNSMQYKKPKYL